MYHSVPLGHLKDTFHLIHSQCSCPLEIQLLCVAFTLQHEQSAYLYPRERDKQTPDTKRKKSSLVALWLYFWVVREFRLFSVNRIIWFTKKSRLFQFPNFHCHFSTKLSL